MRTIVYYDQDLIVPADVAAASLLVGEKALHVRPSDALWPEVAGVEASTILPQRDDRFREIVMDWFDAIVKSTGELPYLGVDLLEAIRYDWVSGIEEFYHRSWAVGELVCRYHAARIHWVTNRPRFLPVVLATSRALNVPCTNNCSLFAVVRSRVRPLRDAIRDRLWLWRENRRTARQMAELAQRRGSTAAAGNPIVFGEHFPNNVKLSNRVAEALEQMSHIAAIYVGGRMSVCKFVQAKGRACFLIDEFTPHRNSAARSARELAKPLELGVRTSSLRRNATSGRSIDDRANPLVEPILRKIMRVSESLLTDAVRWADGCRAMIGQLQPRALVSTSYFSTFGRVLAMSANASGIPFIFIQHGILGGGRFSSRIPCDRLLLWGENIARVCRDNWNSAERIRVVGSPLYDDVSVYRERAQGSGKSSRSNPGSQVVLLASRPGGSVVNAARFEFILRATANSVLTIPEATLTIKLHPSDHSKIAQRLFRNHARITVIKDSDVAELLSSCDVAIVISSTTGLEACVLDKPLIEFNPAGADSGVDYKGYGAAIRVEHECDLAIAIRQALSDPETRDRLALGRRQLVADVLNGAGGDAAKRAAQEIINMVGERHVHAQS